MNNKRLALMRMIVIGGLLLSCGFGLASAIGVAAALLLALCGSPIASASEVGMLLVALGVSVAGIVTCDWLEGKVHDAH